ncbi:MAG: ABC transporter permease, partial [Myxococcota bacterium]
MQIGGPSSVHINAPSAISLTLGILGIFGLFIPAAMLASGVIRDREFKTAELFHSTPVGPRAFILGRFSGGYIATVLAFSSVPLAILIGTQMPWIDPEKLGPTRLFDYFYVFTTLSVVNLFVAGLIFFTVSNLTRSVFATYVTLIAFLVLYFVGLSWGREPEYRAIAAILDPLGLNTLREVTQYWTPAQKNTELVPLSGTFLINRVLWLSVAFVLLAINVLTFSFRSNAKVPKRKKADPEETARTVEKVVLPRVTPEAAHLVLAVDRLEGDQRAVLRKALD